MAISRFDLCRSIASSFLLMGIAASAQAVGWSDDFNDGSATDGMPVSWVEDLNFGGGPSGYFPGTYSAASGDYVLDPDAGPFGPITVSLVPVGFGDTYIRAQSIILPDPLDPLVNYDGYLSLLGRVNPTTLDSYLLYVDVNANGGGTLELQKAVGGAPADIAPTGGVELDFSVANEIILELNIVGDQLSGYAWQPGQPKPAIPQVTATDAEYTAGFAGIAFQEVDPGTVGVFRYVSAQDTPFVDALPGDYNGNGAVDAADYVMWREGLNSDPGQAGYDLWRTNFGNGGAGAGSVVSAAVPEPTGLLLMLAGLAASLVAARRRTV